MIDAIDIFSVVFFSFEYFARLIVSPDRIKFFLQPMNIIDFCCLIPFYISLLLEGLEDVEIVGKAGKMVRFLKILRIFRVYKMFKHFAGLQSLLYTLQQAYKELGLLFHLICKNDYHWHLLYIYFIGVAILSFSSLVYICETEFAETVPVLWRNKTLYVPINTTWTFVESFWWGLMTICTVGYDVNPKESKD